MLKNPYQRTTIRHSTAIAHYVPSNAKVKLSKFGSSSVDSSSFICVQSDFPIEFVLAKIPLP